MSSRMAFFCNKPDPIEYTMNITMTLSEWKQLKESLVSKYPAWELSSEICSMISQASQVYYPKDGAV